MGFQTSGEKNWPTDIGVRLRLGLTDGLHMTGQALVRRTQIGMQGPKSGRVYGGHQASAPGEYSAIRSGTLVRSVDYRVSGPTYITFYATAPHAGYQERGTARMAARENLIRSIRESQGEVRNILEFCASRALLGGR